jgi:hypothetical protein
MAGLFKLVLHEVDLQTRFQEAINVFGYRSNLTVLNEEATLGANFLTKVLPDLVAVLHARSVFTRLEVYNVTNGTGYADIPITTGNAGTVTGDATNQFLAWGFRYNRITAGKRHGSKRFGIIAESSVSDGQPTGGMLTLLTTLAATLSDPVQVGLIDTWFPEILERKAPHVFPWTSHPISAVSFIRVTTQNSRKD